MKKPISEIKIGERIRKDQGNIDELAQNIQKNGLINPIVITPDNQLIAGERRVRACKKLGWSKIEAKVMDISDYEDKLMVEISENELRKNFTFSEKLKWAERLERIEKVKAEERVKQGAKVGAGLTNNKERPMQNFAGGGKGNTRDKVAEEIGLGSGETYRKAKFIKENADEEMIKKLDEDEISVHGAYQELREQKEKLEEENDDLENRVEELKDDKQLLRERMNDLEYKLENDNSEELEKELEEVKEELKNKEKTVENLQSNLADVSRSEMKISTERIRDRCKQISKNNKKLFEEVNFTIKEEDVDEQEVMDSLFRLQENLDSISDDIKTLIEQNLTREEVIDVN